VCGEGPADIKVGGDAVVTMHLVVRMPQQGKSTGFSRPRSVWCFLAKGPRPCMGCATRTLTRACVAVWRTADNAAGEVEKVGARCSCLIA
jgi:hypothetical protein